MVLDMQKTNLPPQKKQNPLVSVLLVVDFGRTNPPHRSGTSRSRFAVPFGHPSVPHRMNERTPPCSCERCGVPQFPPNTGDPGDPQKQVTGDPIYFLGR